MCKTFGFTYSTISANTTLSLGLVRVLYMSSGIAQLLQEAKLIAPIGNKWAVNSALQSSSCQNSTSHAKLISVALQCRSAMWS